MEKEMRLIDVNSALERLKEAEQEMRVVRIVGHKAVSIDAVIQFLEERPTVDAVEVKHGEWLDGAGVDHNGNTVYISIDCSVCEEVFKIETHDREYWKARFKVCPFCGAKMDGDGDGT